MLYHSRGVTQFYGICFVNNYLHPRVYISNLWYICDIFNKSGIVNRLFFAITVSLAIWSFAYSVALSARTAEESTFWRCITVFGWGSFTA